MSAGRTVAIVGGGLAGLAAGCALADRGFRIELFERKPFLGGRASSYEHPGTGEVIDNCQHVLLGCCTNLLDLYGRIGVVDRVRWYDRLTFIEPGGARSQIAPTFLPAPLHSAPSFFRARALTVRDKLSIARAMLALVPRLPADDGAASFATWLQRHGQTPAAISRFWQPVLVSALNEELDRVSVSSAALVFRDAFLKSAEAGRMGLPAMPLSQLYAHAGEYIRQHGGSVHLRSSANSVAVERDRVRVCVGGAEYSVDYAVLAVPFRALDSLLPNSEQFAALRQSASHLETAPITGVHLWFDRQITELDHAVLLDRTIQWMFHKSRILGRDGNGSYVELVISSSKSLVEKSRQEVLEMALRELGEFFPAVREASVIKTAVVKEVHATFVPGPGSDQHRPGNRTDFERLFIAGDWTATGWPATMEGAVRSGYMCAESLLTMAGDSGRVLVPDLPARGFMRLFA